ncbi:MAG: 5-methyltetrahydropteroyltriglutamate--homocysteine S-methyltransferase [Burkholderiales bacterium]|nr:5-methyltetrahydropteroyltriglutamate--homocysteine S-methyltransferase [Burkholderiales bacterium]
MTHPLTRLRTDQVGSLLRPDALIRAFLDRGRGVIDDAALDAAADTAIRDLVAKQEARGMAVVTDGEYRRLNWQVSFSEVAGWDLWRGSWQGFLANPSLVGAGEKPLSRGRDAVESFKVPATGRLALTRNFPLREYRFLQSVATAPTKAMLMGPDRVAQMCDIAGSAPHYASTDDFLADVVAIQRRMVGELLDAGCPYVQLDEPSYTGYVDRDTLARMAARGEDPLANLKRAVAASNAVIDGYAGRACFGLHICRGNRASMWHREGTYDGIAEYLFANLKFDRLLLEYDTARAGGFEPLRHVPRGGPTVVLGLITTKTGELESADALCRRIDDASRFIDLDQLALSPQCGFASGISGNQLSEDAQWRKIDRMAEVARRVWG